MAAIQNLPTALPANLTPGDYTVGFSNNLGCDVKYTLTTLAAVIQGLLVAPGAMAQQFSAPNATGFSVAIAAASTGLGQSTWLILTPAATYATGTITLPPVAICQDNMEVLVSCTQIVTALTVAPNGATVNGAPTTLAANGTFRLKYALVNKSWYLVT